MFSNNTFVEIELIKNTLYFSIFASQVLKMKNLQKKITWFKMNKITKLNNNYFSIFKEGRWLKKNVIFILSLKFYSTTGQDTYLKLHSFYAFNIYLRKIIFNLKNKDISFFLDQKNVYRLLCESGNFFFNKMLFKSQLQSL